jgi:CHAT domain-containing protein
MVIASTRKVNDRTSASLFSAFYRRLAAGDSPEEALRTAQLEALTASRGTAAPSFEWVAFQLYGAIHGTHNQPIGESR